MSPGQRRVRPLRAALAVVAGAVILARPLPAPEPAATAVLAGAPTGPAAIPVRPPPDDPDETALSAPEPRPTTELAAQVPAVRRATRPAVAAARGSGRQDGDRVGARRPPTRTLAAPRANETLAQRRDRLVDAVPYSWRSVGFTVVFAGPRPGLLGLTDPDDRTITVFVRRGQSDRSLLDTIGHELGHAVDVTHGTRARRAEYLRLRGLPASTPWWPCASCSDYASGAGDFAEVFAVWVVGSQSFSSELAGRPSAARLAALRHLFVGPPEPPAKEPVVPAVVDAAAEVTSALGSTVITLLPSAAPAPTPKPTPLPSRPPAVTTSVPLTSWLPWLVPSPGSWLDGRRTRR